MVQKLRSLAESSTFEEIETSKGKIRIETLKIHFDRVSDPLALLTKLGLLDMYQSLKETHKAKPLVALANNGNDANNVFFGELAILRCLQDDGWDGVWVDTYHRKFWHSLSDGGTAKLVGEQKTLYDKIVKANGGQIKGFFDVLAWRNGSYIFIEYKGKGDSVRQNQIQWIDAALSSGISQEQLFFVAY